MLTLALMFAAFTPAGLCGPALAAAPDRGCAVTPKGAVLAESEAEAQRLAGYLVPAEERFARHFGGEIAPYVVVAVPPTPDAAALKAAGFTHVLSWPSGQAFREATRRGIEQAARGFATSQNMSEAQTQQVIANAMSRTPDDRALAAIDAGMMPHELGHLLFTAAFWPDDRSAPGQRPKHYGGPGPDWLDEAAAIVMEDAPTAELRRTQFRDLMRGETVASIGPIDARPILTDLPGLLDKPHPGLARLQDPNFRPPAPPVPGGASVGVNYRPATGGQRPDALDTVFYIQIRVFIDYLIETTGRPGVLADIARAAAAGRSMADWLAADGAALGLPASVEALNQGWRTYIEQV